MSVAAKPPYRPPEIDPDMHAKIALADLRPGAELHEWQTVTGIGALVDLNTVETAAADTMLNGHANLTEEPLVPQYRGRYDPARAKADMNVGIGTYLRPANFSGGIVHGLVHVLPYDKQRTDSYAPSERQRPTVHAAVTLYIMGSLSSRETVSSPFAQEVTLYMTVGGLVKRYLGPRDSLKAAAAEMAKVRKRAIADANSGPGADLAARGRELAGRSRSPAILDIDDER